MASKSPLRISEDLNLKKAFVPSILTADPRTLLSNEQQSRKVDHDADAMLTKRAQKELAVISTERREQQSRARAREVVAQQSETLVGAHSFLGSSTSSRRSILLHSPVSPSRGSLSGIVDVESGGEGTSSSSSFNPRLMRLAKTSARHLLEKEELYGRAQLLDKEQWKWDVNQRLANGVFLQQIWAPRYATFLRETEPETRSALFRREERERGFLDEYHKQLKNALVLIKDGVKRLQAREHEQQALLRRNTEAKRRRRTMMVNLSSPTTSFAASATLSVEGPQIPDRDVSDDHSDISMSAASSPRSNYVSPVQRVASFVGSTSDDDDVFGGGATVVIRAQDLSDYAAFRSDSIVDPSRAVPEAIRHSFSVAIDISPLIVDEKLARRAVRQREAEARIKLWQRGKKQGDTAMAKQRRREHLRRCEVWRWEADRRRRKDEIDRENQEELGILEGEETAWRGALESERYEELLVILWGNRGVVIQRALMRTEKYMRNHYHKQREEEVTKDFRFHERETRLCIAREEASALVVLDETYRTIHNMWWGEFTASCLAALIKEEENDREHILAEEAWIRVDELSDVPLLQLLADEKLLRLGLTTEEEIDRRKNPPTLEEQLKAIEAEEEQARPQVELTEHRLRLAYAVDCERQLQLILIRQTLLEGRLEEQRLILEDLILTESERRAGIEQQSIAGLQQLFAAAS